MAEIKLEELIARNSLAGDTVLTIGSDGQIAMVNVVASDNNPPVVNDQSLNASTGASLTITLGPLTDADGDTVAYTVTGDGAANYTPTNDNSGVFNSSTAGVEVLNISASDGTDTDTAIITITVSAVVVNNPPVVNDQNLNVDESVNLAITLGPLTDVDGDTVTYTVTGAGAANYTPTAANTGTFNSSTVGSETLNVTASDGTDSDTATITITVSSVIPVGAAYNAASGDNLIVGLPAKKTAHVYMGSGQSNGQGRGARVDAPLGSDPGPITGVKTWRRSQDGDMFSGTGAWYPLDYEYNQYEGRNEFGSILQLGLHLSDYIHTANDDVYFIAANSNGVPIQNWLDGGAEQVALYAHINAGLLSLVNDPEIDEVIVHDFFFDQGESDSGTTELANAYKLKEQRVISELRDHLGLPNLSFTIRQLDSTLDYPFVSTVIAAQNAVADEDVNVHIIKGPYTYNLDEIHLDGNSQNIVGDQRFEVTKTNKGQVYNG